MIHWKNPTKRVYYSVVCPNCHRLITRMKHPGLLRKTTSRLCQNCTSKQSVAPGGGQQAAAPAPAARGTR